MNNKSTILSLLLTLILLCPLANTHSIESIPKPTTRLYKSGWEFWEDYKCELSTFALNVCALITDEYEVISIKIIDGEKKHSFRNNASFASSISEDPELLKILDVLMLGDRTRVPQIRFAEQYIEFYVLTDNEFHTTLNYLYGGTSETKESTTIQIINEHWVLQTKYKS